MNVFTVTSNNGRARLFQMQTSHLVCSRHSSSQLQTFLDWRGTAHTFSDLSSSHSCMVGFPWHRSVHSIFDRTFLTTRLEFAVEQILPPGVLLFWAVYSIPETILLPGSIACNVVGRTTKERHTRTIEPDTNLNAEPFILPTPLWKKLIDQN